MAPAALAGVELPPWAIGGDQTRHQVTRALEHPRALAKGCSRVGQETDGYYHQHAIKDAVGERERLAGCPANTDAAGPGHLEDPGGRVNAQPYSKRAGESSRADAHFEPAPAADSGKPLQRGDFPGEDQAPRR